MKMPEGFLWDGTFRSVVYLKEQQRRVPMINAPNVIGRIMWIADFNKLMETQFNIFYNGQRSSVDKFRVRDSADVGTEDFWAYGERLRNLPDPGTAEFDSMCRLYRSTAKLLATRPWNRFASFEVLKVTVTKEEAKTKWVMFLNEDINDERSSSPFGFLQLFECQANLGYCFGKESLWLQSGLMGPSVPPDRMFVASESLSKVHYDTIFLLDHLFGDSLLFPVLPCGVIPLIKAETGSIPGHCGCSIPTGGRRFSKDETQWIQLSLPSLTKFVMEESASCEWHGGEWTKTYDADAQGNPVSSSPVVTVSVSYNKGIENGGLWDRDRKWQWF